MYVVTYDIFCSSFSFGEKSDSLFVVLYSMQIDNNQSHLPTSQRRECVCANAKQTINFVIIVICFYFLFTCRGNYGFFCWHFHNAPALSHSLCGFSIFLVLTVCCTLNGISNIDREARFSEWHKDSKKRVRGRERESEQKKEQAKIRNHSIGSHQTMYRVQYICGIEYLR